MEANVILDTGPLVAYLDARDEHHAWAVEQFGGITNSMISCEAVLTEVCFLLQRFPRALEMIAQYLRDEIIITPFSISQHHTRVFNLLKQYHAVPMSLADACVVCMAEDSRGSRVFTLDSDFHIYRLRGRSAIPLISPE